MQAVNHNQPSLADLATKLEVLTKKVEDLTTVQREPVKMVFTINNFYETLECSFFNVSKKLSREFYMHGKMFDGPIADSTRNICYWHLSDSHLLHDRKDLGSFREKKKLELEKFFKDLNVPYNIVIFDGPIDKYLDQF